MQFVRLARGLLAASTRAHFALGANNSVSVTGRRLVKCETKTKTPLTSLSCLAGLATLQSRHYSGGSAMVFDSKLKILHRERVARITNYGDKLQNEIAHRLVDRLADCTRSFKDVLVVGGAGLIVAKKLVDSGQSLESITYVETSEALLEDFEARLAVDYLDSKVEFKSVRLETSEESLRGSLSDKRFDAAISCLGLHWVNNLPSALVQIKDSLRPDGFFIGAFFGGDTLQELRIACSIAEMEREGGVSPRTSPLARVRDAGSLLSVAGYSLPVVDVDTISIRYKSVAHLVEHLRRLGESNANMNRRGLLKRDSAVATAAVYHSLFAEDDSTIPSTYQIIYISGWSPHQSQQKPMDRGAASASFKDLKREITNLNAERDEEGKGDV